MRAKKSYGQHFLTNEHIAARIADSLVDSTAYHEVLEVGPGKGMLTKYLLEKEHLLRVVEADRDMVNHLQQHFPVLHNRIIHQDVLKLRMDEYFDGQFAIIGNFPYNISSQIVFKVLDYRQYIPEVVGMFQKEMAQRIASVPGNKTYGVISVLAQAWYEVRYLFEVSNGNFSPPPKVTSAVLHFRRKTQTVLGCDESLFKTVVKLTFGQRRKMLRNTLKALIHDAAFLQDDFCRKRPEQLSVEEFVWLTNQVAEYRSIED